MTDGVDYGQVDVELCLDVCRLVGQELDGLVATYVRELTLAFFAALDGNSGIALELCQLCERSVAAVVRFFVFGAKQNVARKGAGAGVAGGLRGNRHNDWHHAGACTAEFVLQVFADGGGDSVFFELRVAVMQNVHHVRIERGELHVQEESVEPRRVVVG